jgi:hypothetical protein
MISSSACSGVVYAPRPSPALGVLTLSSQVGLGYEATWVRLRTRFVTIKHSLATTSTISVSSLPRAWNIDSKRKVLSPHLVSVSPRPRKVMDALMKIFLFSMRKISSILFLPVAVC